MRNGHTIAILVYGDEKSNRNVLSEEKYKDLATSFFEHGFTVESVFYNDGLASELALRLPVFDAVLVWVNPVEQGNDRKRLDELLMKISSQNCFVSTHPEVILKMGTKDILYKTREMDWGGDVKMYTSFEFFAKHFPVSLDSSKVRVLKQYRGNGGNGVFKIDALTDGMVSITHAVSGNEKRILPLAELIKEFSIFFLNQGLLIDQEWNDNIANGMVRCYVAGTKVAGFGYQEVNALYYDKNGNYVAPGKRYYFTENCGIFSDLKKIMESRWIPELQKALDIPNNMMPVIWDADFFINSTAGSATIGKYTLCEINVSCVSPFPPSSIKFMVAEVANRVTMKAISI